MTAPGALLLHSLALGEVPAYLTNDDWSCSEKMDGYRCLAVIRKTGEVSFFTRGGRPLKNSAALLRLPAIRAELAGCASEMEITLDGELMLDGSYWLFDLPQAGDIVTPADPYYVRRRALETLAAAAAAAATWHAVKLLPVAWTTTQKQQLTARVANANGEGVVLRHRDGNYAEGRARHSLKAKFVKTVDCVVTARGTNPCNATLAVYDRGALVPLGRASMLGKAKVRVGDVVEVRYLGWRPGGSLTQPCILRTRTDKLPAECLADQLIA